MIKVPKRRKAFPGERCSVYDCNGFRIIKICGRWSVYTLPDERDYRDFDTLREATAWCQSQTMRS